MGNRPEAAIIIIGDEILKGQTYDTNSHFLCKNLYQLGVKVNRVVVIPDEINAISKEVEFCSKNYTFVLTSGGIGPTHDDVTYLGVAKAFGEELVKNMELANILCGWFKSLDLKMECIEKTCMLPKSAQLHYPKQSLKEEVFPIVSVFNVYIFPGIPTYLEFSFNFLKEIFSPSSARKFYNRSLYINIDEIKISEILSKAAKKFENKVQIGSYPKILNNIYKVLLILEADSEEPLNEAEIYLRQNLPSNKIVSGSDAISLKNAELLYSFKFFNENNDDDVVHKTISILEECLIRYSLEEICISFNGGKDCTLLLYIACLVFYKLKGDEFQTLNALYIRSKDPFPEMDDFIDTCIQRYRLKIMKYNEPFQPAMLQFRHDHPNIKAVLMGTRSSDPHADNLAAFQPTDPAWGDFMRVHPILHWSYHQVWTFLRRMNVPYCSLYDHGYTSLGNRNNTVPNPKLASGDIYLPAYLLTNSIDEREGRDASVGSSLEI